MCMGVATANSILVIAFARQRMADGLDAVSAAMEAGSTRFRPVIMTALAMILGMVPTAVLPGLNAPLGRAVIGGLLFATCAPWSSCRRCSASCTPAAARRPPGPRAPPPSRPAPDRKERAMSEQPVKPPSRRRLIQVGAIAGAVALAVVVAGVAERMLGGRAVAQQTASQSIPTVALARLTGGEATEALTLPGAIQPYNRAMIHARVSGYLKGWNQDIGAQVRAGQLLATIDAPDLDQQYSRPRPTTARRSRIAGGEPDRGALAGAAAVGVGLPAGGGRKGRRRGRQEGPGGRRARQPAAPGGAGGLQADRRAVRRRGHRAQDRHRRADHRRQPGRGAVRGLRLKRVRIYVRAPQSLSAELVPGRPATFNLPQYPGQSFKAAVVATSRAIDPTSRTLLVQLQADNADGKLFGGAYCQVHFQLAGRPRHHPRAGHRAAAGQQRAKVAVLGPGDKVMLKSVQLGRDLGDSVEIVAGLTRSDRVIDSPPRACGTANRSSWRRRPRRARGK